VHTHAHRGYWYCPLCRYWKEAVFEALKVLKSACEAEHVPMAEASIRWLLHHSVLSGAHHDGIIFGASTLNHAKENLNACTKGPLPASLIEAFETAWQISRPTAFPYFRDYGSAPGSSDTFLRKFQKIVPSSVTC